MRKFFLILIISILFISVYAQKNDEYRYIGVKIFLNNNISFPSTDNNYVLIHSPYGDLLKENNEIFAYTPGGGLSVVYNYDLKNNKAGLIFGIDVQNYGFTNYYKSKENNFKITDQYRTLQIGIPVFLKIGTANIYKNQAYATVGIQFNQFFMTQNLQKVSWTAEKYIGNVPKEVTKKSSISAMLGFNYNVYFVNFQLLSNNFVNPKYTTRTSEGNVKPFQHVNIMNNLYMQIGVNIPLTRWLTARNWGAEKVRRFFTRTE